MQLKMHLFSLYNGLAEGSINIREINRYTDKGGEMMNKWLKGWSIFIFSVGGIVILLVILLIFGTVFSISYFRASLIPDEKEVAKVISQAEQYLQEKYPTMEYEISGFEYDADEQYGEFDYAAVILNTETQNKFLVYENRHTKQMEDDIAFQELTKFIEQVKPKIYSYITETFGEPQGMAFTPQMNYPPMLNIKLNNKKEEINEDMFESFIDYLQYELNVEHASVNIMYENERWSKEF